MPSAEMSKKAARLIKAKRKPGKENENLSKSDSYSDDYRLTPNLLLKGVAPYCNGSNCCLDQSICPQGEVCCSRETCFSPNRRFRRSPVSLCPCRNHLYKEPVYGGHDSQYVQRLKKATKEALVPEGRRFSVRKEPSFDCSSCDSCYFCDSETSFSSSPVETTDASFYTADPLPRRSLGYDRHPKPRSPGRCEGKSPKNREGSRTGNTLRLHDEDLFRWKVNAGEGRSRSGARRAKSFTEVNDFFEHSQKISVKNRSKITDNHHHHKCRNENEKDKRDSDPPSHSPVRNNVRPTDSGMGKSSRTSRSSVTGGRRTHGSKSTERRLGEEREHRVYRKKEERGDASNQKQANLLNKMVNQTREHRRQIKTLESELERLRTSGDALMSCEVSQRDVEWRPGDVVGEGSFSTVYKGAYCGTEVAVKELKCKLSQDDKNYFRSEAALLQQLHHPRIVLLMGVCTSSARPFMLLEYLSGGTLYSLIHQKPRERLDHAGYFSIAKDVAQGLNYLHKHDPQVLHLDLKSVNVLLDNYTRAKIADFGFSILRRSRGVGGGSAVQKGSIRGTPAWMAPELLARGEVSPKCDVYSFAIILWEMLTVSHPFHGLDIYQIMETIEDGGRLALPQEGVSRELRELITSCWAQNPSLRPSFEEILGALETASLPVSWRKVLTRANISPSLFSDVTAARAIIGMIERSVELLEQRSPGPRKRSKSDETEGEMRDKENYQWRISKKSGIFDKHKEFSAPAFSFREKSLSPKITKDHRISPSRKRQLKAINRSSKSSNGHDIDAYTSTRGFSSPVEEWRSRERWPLHPNRKNSTNGESAKSESARQRRSREHRPSKARSSSRIRKRERDERVSVRGQGNGKHSGKDDRERERKKKSYNSKRHYSPSSSKRKEEECMTKESFFCDGKSSRKESRRNYCDSSGEEEDLRRRQTDVSESSVELESCITSSKTNKRREKSAQAKRKSVSSPDRRPRTKSPQRTPNRKNSPKVDADHSRRLDSTHFQKGGGMILTAEQLVSQKQRLRPVRPSGLKDLSHLPQNSLNDISSMLKQVMLQRRDALGKIQSTKGSIRSKDFEWSDWF